MGATVGTELQGGKALELIEETEHLYERYLSISMVADLSQLTVAPGLGHEAEYFGPAPVGLVVTGI